MQNNAINPLKDQLLQLADPRLQRGRKHELIDVLMIAVTALLCGAEDFTHMAQFGKAKESWLRTFLTLSNGIPSHDTFRRVFMLLVFRRVFELDAIPASGGGSGGGGAGWQGSAAEL